MSSNSEGSSKTKSNVRLKSELNSKRRYLNIYSNLNNKLSLKILKKMTVVAGVTLSTIDLM